MCLRSPPSRWQNWDVPLSSYPLCLLGHTVMIPFSATYELIPFYHTVLLEGMFFILHYEVSPDSGRHRAVLQAAITSQRSLAPHLRSFTHFWSLTSYTSFLMAPVQDMNKILSGFPPSLNSVWKLCLHPKHTWIQFLLSWFSPNVGSIKLSSLALLIWGQTHPWIDSKYLCLIITLAESGTDPALSPDICLGSHLLQPTRIPIVFPCTVWSPTSKLLTYC